MTSAMTDDTAAMASQKSAIDPIGTALAGERVLLPRRVPHRGPVFSCGGQQLAPTLAVLLLNEMDESAEVADGRGDQERLHRGTVAKTYPRIAPSNSSEAQAISRS